MSDTDQGVGLPWASEPAAKPIEPAPAVEPVEEPVAEEPKEPDTVAGVMREMFLYLAERIERTTQRQPQDHAIMTNLVARLKAVK